MIDQDRKIIYVDYSTLATFKACKRKGQLQYAIGYTDPKQPASLTAGHAYHAALEAMYDAMAGGFHQKVVDDNGIVTRIWHKFGMLVDPIKIAKAAFLSDLKIEGNTLPVTLESEERRSIERMLALIEAYAWRWRNEPYENILDEDGAPLTEVHFKFQIGHYEGFDIIYVGYIDRLMRSIMTKRPAIFELKTTTGAISLYIQQCKPNDQVTGYYKPARDMFPDLLDCIWDVTFVSSRKADMAKALKDRFWMYGVDIEKDFARQTTTRSKTDITEFLSDTEEWSVDYVKYLMSGKQWWPKTTTACHSYGGCRFRPACSVNDEGRRAYLESMFEIKLWQPGKAIAGPGWWQE